MRIDRLCGAIVALVMATIGCSTTTTPTGATSAPTTTPTGATSAPTTSAPPTAAGTAPSATLTASDFTFTPTLVPIHRKSSVEFVNQGTVTHNFSIGAQHVDVDTASGARTTLATGNLPAGRYTFFCKYHRGQGMMGTLVVD